MSKKILILAEKPSLGRDIAIALGVSKTNHRGHHENEKYIIAPLSGHLLEATYEKVPYGKEYLPLKGLEHPNMQPKSGDDYIENRIQSVLEELNREDIIEVVSAGDADQEGSLLVYELLEYTKVLDKLTITRMWIQAVDEKTLKEAFDNRYDIEKDIPWVIAAKTRAFADVYVGFNLSRLYKMKSPNRDLKVSVGRVRTAMMKIVRYREEEIENFVSVPYLNIKGTFGKTLEASLFIPTGEENNNKTTTRISIEYYNDNDLDKYFNTNPKFKVADVNNKNKSTPPDLLPDQNDILKNVGKLHKVKTEEVVEAMQSLYENQFISYPRTEKRHLPVSLYPKMEGVIKSLTEIYSDNIGEKDVTLDVSNKRIFNDDEVEEHFAVVPWSIRSAADIEKLSVLEKQTYDYIVAKFIMSCMGAYKYGTTTVTLKDSTKDILFKATGKIETDKGFKAYKYLTNKISKDKILPTVTPGQDLVLESFEKKKEATKPPSLFDEADLGDMMKNVSRLYNKETLSDEEEYYQEKFSLGTPATRPGIIKSVISTYKYLTYNDKDKIITTPEGKQLLELLGDTIDIQLTANFEREMKEIRKDKDLAAHFNTMIKEYVDGIIDAEIDSLPDTFKNILLDDVTCPLCSSCMIQTQKTFKCEKNEYKDDKQSGCTFSIFIDQEKFFGKKLVKEDLEALLFSSIDNPLEGEKNDIYFDKENKYFIGIVFKDTGELYETDKTFRMGDKWCYKRINFKNLTEDEAEKILSGETVILKRISKQKKPYKANAFLSSANDGTVTLEINKRKRK